MKRNNLWILLNGKQAVYLPVKRLPPWNCSALKNSLSGQNVIQSVVLGMTQ